MTGSACMTGFTMFVSIQPFHVFHMRKEDSPVLVISAITFAATVLFWLWIQRLAKSKCQGVASCDNLISLLMMEDNLARFDASDVGGAGLSRAGLTAEAYPEL